MLETNIALFGYSGHAFVVIDIFKTMGKEIKGYLTENPAEQNPYKIDYLGFEAQIEALEKIMNTPYFVAVGSNTIREKITNSVYNVFRYSPINAIHKKASISTTAQIGTGIMIGDRVVVNACSTIGNGVICNTGSIIEHECIIGDYVHIAPGSVLCGNVIVGERTLIGAGSVVTPGVRIGSNVVIGAGTTVINDIPDNSKVVGNPQRYI